MLKVRATPTGPRVYIFGRRVHHGACGLCAVILGAWAILDDLSDFPWLPGRD